MRYRKGKFGLSSFMKDKTNTDLVSGVANNLSGAISAVDTNNNTGANVASSALSGLGMGMQTGNPYAAVVGLVGGGLYGLFSSQKQKKDEFNRMVLEDDNNKTLTSSNTAMQYNNNPSLRGDKNTGYYKTGGEIDSPNVNYVNGKPLQKSLSSRMLMKGLNILDYPHKKIIQAIGGNGNQMYSDLLNEKRKAKSGLFGTLDNINPKINDIIGEAGDFFVDPLMLSKVKSVKGASKVVESGNKLYRGFNTLDKIGDIYDVINKNTKKAFGGEIDAKDALGRTYIKKRDNIFGLNGTKQDYFYNQDSKKFIPYDENEFNKVNDNIKQLDTEKTLINKKAMYSDFPKERISAYAFMNKKYGSPNLRKVKSNYQDSNFDISDILTGGANHYDNNSNTISLKSHSEENYLPELSHSAQQKLMPYSNLRVLKEKILNKDPYSVKGTIENIAHTVIEPNLRKEFANLTQKRRKLALGGSLNLSNTKSTGGKLHELTNNDSLIVGKSHEQGGVKFPEHGVELEGGETMNDNFVFSKQLGFADKHLKLIKQKSKFEELAKVRFNDKSLINSINFTNIKIEKLKHQQEALKEQLGMENDSETLAKGGLLFSKNDLLKTSFNQDDIPLAKLIDYEMSKRNPESNNFDFTGNQNIMQGKTSKVDSIAVSHNNPRNIKFGNFAKQFGATEGRRAKDGGSFAYFPNVETGLEAGKSLMKGKGYKDLTVDSALKRWSNNGYGDSLMPEIRGKKIKDLSDSELSELTKRQIKAEDKNMYNQIYGKYAMGGLLSMKLGGLTPEEKRTKALMDSFNKKTQNKNYDEIAGDDAKKEKIIRDKEIEKEKKIRNNFNFNTVPFRTSTANPNLTKQYDEEKINTSSKVNDSNISNFFDNIFSNSNKSGVEQSIKNRSKGNTSNISRKEEPYIQNRNTKRKGSGFKFGDLFPDAPKNSASGANPITGQQYNRNKNNLNPVTQNKKLEKILGYNQFNQNNISLNDGSQNRPDISENKIKPLISSRSKKSIDYIQPSIKANTNTAITKSPILNNDFSNIGKQNQTGYANEQYYGLNEKGTTGVKPLSNDELLSQRKYSSKMLSDEQLNTKPTLAKAFFDKESLLNGINTFGSDAIGLLRKYPNVPSPVLDSNVKLQRQRADGEYVQNNQDMSNALLGTGNLSASVGAGLRSNLLATKLKANNQVAQRLNESNTEIGNREAMINANINSNNNRSLNQFNNDVVDRQYAIGNNQQEYVSNISSKMLQQSQDKKRDDLDLAKLSIYSSMVDKGVQNKVNSSIGLDDEIINRGKRALLSSFGKKKFGGRLKLN